jgi:hypothetical protein
MTNIWTIREKQIVCIAYPVIRLTSVLLVTHYMIFEIGA